MWECITVQGLKKHIESSNKQGYTVHKRLKRKVRDRNVKRGKGEQGKMVSMHTEKKADTSNTELGGALG